MRWLVLPVVAAIGFAGGVLLLGLWAPAFSGAAADYLTVGYRDLDKGSLKAIATATTSFERAAELTPDRAEVRAALAMAELARADALVWTAARGTAAGGGEGAAEAGELMQHANEAAERGFASAQAALHANPRNPQAQLALADYYRLKGDLARARQWRDAAQQSGADEDALVLADAALASSEGSASKEVMASLDGLLTRNPANQRARFLGAALRWAAGDHERAHTLARQLLAEVADHERAAWYVDATSPAPTSNGAPSAGDEKPDGEEKATADIAAEGSADIGALLLEATKLRTRDRPKQAIEVYEKVLALEPDNARAVLGKAWCLVDLGRSHEAVELLQPLVESKPRLGPALFALATALEDDNQPGPAVKYYRRYLKVSPDADDAELVQATIDRLSK